MKHALRTLLDLYEGSETDGVGARSVRQELGGGNAVEWETALLLYGLVRREKPRVVVETGTHKGLSAAVIALALQENWEDRADDDHAVPALWTWDVDDYGQAELWESLGVREIIYFQQADSRAGRVPPSIPAAGIDFLWLDADHGTEAVLDEWRRFAPHLSRRRALVGFHDTTLDPREAKAIATILQGGDGRGMDPIPEYLHTAYWPIRNLRGLDLLLLSNEAKDGVIL